MSTVVDGVDLSTLDVWSLPREERLSAFATLRETAPVAWHGSNDHGFWSVTRYDDVRRVSRDPQTFSSAQGIVLLENPAEAAIGLPSFIAMDDPDHGRLRGLVQQAFSPRRLASIEQQIQQDAEDIVNGLESDSDGDFVDLVAKQLPLLTICRMLGVPDADRAGISGHVDALSSFQDPEFCAGRPSMEVAVEAAMGLAGYAFEVIKQRRAHPSDDDLLGALVGTTVGGQALDDAEIAQFLLLLAFAGSDTTRNTTSYAMKALTDFPDQREALRADPDGVFPSAIEEFARWASPVMHFKRTATVDTEIGGQPVAAGQSVVMVYPAANRDGRAFTDPDRFDVRRSPNRHVGFGGGGPHFCLGAVLARRQLRALFGELLRAFPDLQVGEPKCIVGNLIDAVRELPMQTGRRVV